MEVIAELAEFLDAHSERASRLGFSSMVEQFRGSLLGELDYRREAANLKLLATSWPTPRRSSSRSRSTTTPPRGC